uniref:Uncharacterized protein n=1 Tax=Octopus bimaculoides TaxID=37653 RepID=A0A0L8GDJ7_OCTBM
MIIMIIIIIITAVTASVFSYWPTPIPGHEFTVHFLEDLSFNLLHTPQPISCHYSLSSLPFCCFSSTVLFSCNLTPIPTHFNTCFFWGFFSKFQ